MSKTIRRKNVSYYKKRCTILNYELLLWSIDYNNRRMLCGAKYKTEEVLMQEYEDDLQKELGSYHRDTHNPMNAPAWYRIHRNRLYRHKTKNKIRVQIARGEYDLLLDPPLSDVNWYFY